MSATVSRLMVPEYFAVALNPLAVSGLNGSPCCFSLTGTFTLALDTKDVTRHDDYWAPRRVVGRDIRLSLGGDVSLVLLHGGDEVLADRDTVLEVEVVVDGSERK